MLEEIKYSETTERSPKNKKEYFFKKITLKIYYDPCNWPRPALQDKL